MAKKTGYLDYAREHYELEEICRLYDGEITEWEEIYFPSGELPAMKVFYEFYDDFLNRILEESQKVFPDLSMEVRLDMDPIYGMDETMYGFSHESTFSCQDSAFTSAMYSMSMGQSRQKELTARQALDQMPGVLDRLFSFSGGKPIYLDQLLFTDNTPGFEENPRLAEAEEAEFLRSAAPVLEESGPTGTTATTNCTIPSLLLAQKDGRPRGFGWRRRITAGPPYLPKLPCPRKSTTARPALQERE